MSPRSSTFFRGVTLPWPMKKPDKACSEIPEKDLDESFRALGRYYRFELKDKRYRCRSVMELRYEETSGEAADAVFVLMNPGRRSRPLVPWSLLRLEDAEIVEAKPDKTQYQLMRLMVAFGWSFVRVINLSDLRTANSKVLRHFLKKRFVGGSGEAHNHSIFSKERRRELGRAFKRTSTAPIVAAWGVDNGLECCARVALKTLARHQVIGLAKHGCEWAYLHPQPLGQRDRQIKWCQDMINVIDEWRAGRD